MSIERSCVLAALLMGVSALAQEAMPPAKRSNFVRAESETRVPLQAAPGQIDERILATPGQSVNASEVVEEMLDDLAGDLAALGTAQLSPLVIEGIEVSPNVNPRYAALLETRLIAALQRTHAVRVVRCLECRTTRVDVEGAAWTARQGLTRRSDLATLAEGYGAKAVLRGVLTLRQQPDGLALDVEVTRLADAQVLFAEGYRYDAGTALLYRGADATATRAQRRKELEDRLDGRPSFGHGVSFGGMLVPSEGEEGPVMGGFASYRIYESFGRYRDFRAGLNLGGFIHSSRLAGAVLQASLHRRVNALNVYGPQLFLGLGAGGFLTGGGGNTGMGTFSAELLLGQRLMLQASVSWIHPFEFAGGGSNVGGITPQAGAGISW